MDISELKKSIIGEIESRKFELTELCLKIHSNPEMGFEEFKASKWLTEFLGKNGFSIEKNIGDMPTAFRASYGSGKPVIAFLAEYDALPEIGHACGHNIIGTAAAGAGVAAKLAADLRGTVLVLGTPAEELHGGKILLAERGVFNGIDAALMVHPEAVDSATVKALACQNLEVEFFGKSAHAASNPQEGRNALEAMLLSFNSINSLRQHIKTSARIHGIITDGGKAANVVPEHSAGLFIVRDEDDSYLDELKERVLDCFKGAGQATGTRLEYKWGNTRYAAMRNNLILAALFQKNMESLGRRVELDKSGSFLGSTDMGNVSQLMPAIHPFVAITAPNISTHTKEFTRAAASETGIRGMLDAAKALALTAADLIYSPDILEQASKEFVKDG